VVATTAMTFCATVSVIEHLGATPLLVDIDRATMNIDPDQLEDRLATWDRRAGTPKALMPVHYGGNPCDLRAIDRIASDYGLAVVEDAAHALPARSGDLIGATRRHDAPHAPCFSFYATKNLTTGEGGMLTGAADFVEDCRPWSLHGMRSDAWNRQASAGAWFYEVDRPGFKYNMSDIQAAIGLQQLRKVERFHERRRSIAVRYDEAFRELPELRTPVVTDGADSSWHLYVLRLHTELLRIDRNDFICALAARNIGTSVHFIPVHLHPWYRDRYGFRPEDFPVAHDEYQRSLSLPIHPGMTDDDVGDVIDAVVQTVRISRRR
jgi:dTDP-4-amino-4,6-dideoxygalactose transaminase